MIFKKQIQEQTQNDSDSSSLLLTIDKSPSPNSNKKPPKFYTVTDQYLLTIIKEQRHTMEEVDDLRGQLQMMKERLYKWENGTQKKHITKNNHYSQSTEKSYKNSERWGGSKNSNIYLSPDLIVRETSRKKQKKQAPFRQYGGRDKIVAHKKYEFMIDSRHKKKSKPKYAIEGGQGANSATYLQIKKLRDQFNVLSSEQLRERDLVQKKRKRKELIRLSKYIDHLEHLEEPKQHQLNAVY